MALEEIFLATPFFPSRNSGLCHEGWQPLVPGGEGKEGLHRTTQAGEDGSEGPGTGAFQMPA